MKIHDISMTVHPDMPVYKGRVEKRPMMSTDSEFTTGTAYETRLTMNLHTGTHLDAPLHFLEGGGTIDQMPLEKVVARCRVLDLTHVTGGISANDLERKTINQGDFVLLKSRNSFEDILEGDFVYLDGTGAQYLKNKKIVGVGSDSLGIERAQPAHETHKALLGAGIVILEGLRLADVPEGEYLLVAAPVKMRAEAAPARALLIEGLQDQAPFR
jgi:arylformamidase